MAIKELLLSKLKFYSIVWLVEWIVYSSTTDSEAELKKKNQWIMNLFAIDNRIINAD